MGGGGEDLEIYLTIVDTYGADEMKACERHCPSYCGTCEQIRHDTWAYPKMTNYGEYCPAPVNPNIGCIEREKKGEKLIVTLVSAFKTMDECKFGCASHNCCGCGYLDPTIVVNYDKFCSVDANATAATVFFVA